MIGREKGTDVSGDSLMISFLDDGILLKDIVYQLRGDLDLDLAVVASRWTRIDHLGGSAFSLGYSLGQGLQNVLKREQKQIGSIFVRYSAGWKVPAGLQKKERHGERHSNVKSYSPPFLPRTLPRPSARL